MNWGLAQDVLFIGYKHLKIVILCIVDFTNFLQILHYQPHLLEFVVH